MKLFQRNLSYLTVSLFLLFTSSSCSFNPVGPTFEKEELIYSERNPSSETAYEKSCAAIVSHIINSNYYTKSKVGLTEIEKSLEGLPPFVVLEEQLKIVLKELEVTNPNLASKVQKAINKKNSSGAKALEIKTSQFAQKMASFLNGPFKKITGPRGVSEPFVKMVMIDEDTLFVFHEGDKFPFIIKWDDVMAPKVDLVARADLKLQNFLEVPEVTAFQVLSIPRGMTEVEDLDLLDSEVRALITGSQMNRYIASDRSLIMKIAAILHDEQLMFDRPTQKEFMSIRQKLNTDQDLRRIVDSLLFIAPTAAGKTRILGANVINKVKQVNSLLTKNPKYPKKLSVVMANTPDLVNQLAFEIGKHVRSEIIPANYRIIQWGGLLSEDMPLQALMKMVENSDMPVILITSSQTIASRVKSDDEITGLFKLANSLSIDEAHNSSSGTFKRVMNASLQIAKLDRQKSDVSDALDILGVTASPLTRTQRTVDVFGRSYWASIDTPSGFAKEVKDTANGVERSTSATDVIEYVRIQQQFQNARVRGEITAPESPLYFNPKDYGYKFDSVFGRGASGTQPTVSIDKLTEIWPTIFPIINNHGRGVIQTYPRDADSVAKTLSSLTGKNYVSLNLGDVKRDAVLNAFKTGGLYEGKTVDAIVGRIKEGLDFPEAGWFLSFIRYVRFPGNIQAQGRVVRLSPNKVTPPIIYFGEAVDKIAFQDVRDLIFNKLGKLPRSLSEGRGFSASRIFAKTHPNSSLGKATPELNTAIEVLFRQNGGLAREYAADEIVDPEVILKLQKVVNDLRRMRGNHEVAQALNHFTHQVQSYKFARETLNETWKYCDGLLKAKTKGAPYSKNFTPFDLKILNDDAEMERVAEFRAMKAWLGGITRDVLQDMPLPSRGVYDLADRMNAFANRYDDKAVEAINGWIFKDEFTQAVNVSTEALWDKLNYRSRAVFDSFFKQAQEKSIEENLNEYFAVNGKLPNFFFDNLEDGKEVLLKDKLSHRLAERFQAYIQSGKIDLSKLDRKFLEALDASSFYGKTVGHALAALQTQLTKVAREVGPEAFKEITISFEDLSQHQAFGSFRIVEQLAEMNYRHSIEIKRTIENVLRKK